MAQWCFLLFFALGLVGSNPPPLGSPDHVVMLQLFWIKLLTVRLIPTYHNGRVHAIDGLGEGSPSGLVAGHWSYHLGGGVGGGLVALAGGRDGACGLAQAP
jgi:hypothetical protein